MGLTIHWIRSARLRLTSHCHVLGEAQEGAVEAPSWFTASA